MADMVGPGGAIFLAVAGGFVGFAFTLKGVSKSRVVLGPLAPAPWALILGPDEPPAAPADPSPPEPGPGPGVLDPRWKTENVLGVARMIRAEAAFHLLPVLGDALMDAGCSDEEILACCRPQAGLAPVSGSSTCC